MGSSENYFGNESPVRRVTADEGLPAGRLPGHAGPVSPADGRRGGALLRRHRRGPDGERDLAGRDPLLQRAERGGRAAGLLPDRRRARVSAREGPATACRPRPSGNTPAARAARAATTSATTRRSCRSMPGSRTTRATRSSRSDAGRPTRSACTICTETSGSGAGTGMGPMTRPIASTRRGRPRGDARVLRGGSWYDPAPSLCSSARVSWEPNDTEMTAWKFGFRVAGVPGRSHDLEHVVNGRRGRTQGQFA